MTTAARPSTALPTPSRMGWDTPHVIEVLTYLEQLPRPDRHASAAARIRDREAELAVLAEASAGTKPLRELRVDDELLAGLNLVLLLT